MEKYECYSNTEAKTCKRGVCIFIKKSFSVSPLEVIGQIEVEESVWCEMKLRNNDKLLIGCIYRSPNSTLENNARLNKMIIDAARLKTFTHVLTGGTLTTQE